MKSIRFGALAFAAVSAVCLGPSPAWAQRHALFAGDSARRAAAVPYADLDLGSEAGRDELRRRIDGAVNRLCAAVAAEPLAIHARARCRERALDQVGDQLRRANARAASPGGPAGGRPTDRVPR